MKNKIQFMFLAVALMFTAFTMAQSTVTGTVLDSEINSPLPSASVIEKGTTNGTTTDFDGKFTLETQSESGEIIISYVGYGSVTVSFNGDTDLGNVSVSSDNSLDEVVIVGKGVIDLAGGRETPIAVSTIKAKEIQEKAGNWDLPEVLKSTPSVQNVKGGGFGDGSMFLRGFDQTNTAFLLNGQPINGMEDGKMYWSNWSGVLDVANAVQVQRGLGASKLAISSVGGTINIVTKTIDNKEGGFVQQMIGNDDYTKTTAYYSTGKNEKGWSFSGMLGHWQGDGYVNYTHGQGQTYFFSVGYQPNEKNTFNFLITGAPQWHAAAGSGSIQDFLDNGRKYNSWNIGNVNSPNTLDGPRGKRYPGGRNFYHKPVANLSWDYNINDKSSLSTVLYGSLGRGGFGSAIINDGTGYVRGSMNNHNWFGLVSNYNNELSENLSLNIGTDLRTYNGIHFRAVNEFIGIDSLDASSPFLGDYTVTDVFGGFNPWNAVFNPNNEVSQRIQRNYEEVITYYGLFGQLEYSKNEVSAFFQGAISNQDHIATNEFNYTESTDSDKVSNLGFNLKAGAAYEISKNHKIFTNVGFYSRQPFHDNLFNDLRSSIDLITPEIENEKITGLEAGYQFGSEKISANLNVYHTTWDNRTINSNNGENGESPTFEGYQTQGVKQVHMGVELEVMSNPLDNLKLNGFISMGEWQYKGNANQRTFDGNGVLKSTQSVEIDGFEVGGAAQVTAGINGTYTILPRFTIDGAWNWYNDQYSEGSLTSEPLQMPSYDTVDAGLSYKLLVGKEDTNSIQFRLNVNNLFDEVYLESVSGNTPLSADPNQNWKGLNTANNGRFGYGRTWNFSVRYNF